jgi:hypothetical protein
LRGFLDEVTGVPSEAQILHRVAFGVNAPPASERLDLITAMLAGLDAVRD